MDINNNEILSSIPFLSELKESTSDIPIYLVGGSVRDSILNRKFYDWDFAVEGDSKRVAKKFASLTNSSFVVLDEFYHTYRVVLRDSSYYMDFISCRGHTIENDLSLRDFTINSLAINVKTGEFIDNCHGLDDLALKMIKSCHKENLRDDPLRMLRAYRLKAQLDFSIDPETKQWIKTYAFDLNKIAWERIRDEFFKILKCFDSYSILKEVYNMGLLLIIFPELEPLIGLEQNKLSKFDLFEHSFESLRKVEELAKSDFDILGVYREKIKEHLLQEIVGKRTRLDLLKLLALLHNIGKPSVKYIEDGILYYTGHPIIGKGLWIDIARRLKLSKKERIIGANEICFHQKPIFISKAVDEKDRKTLIYHLSKTAKDSFIDTIVLSWADVEACREENIKIDIKIDLIDNHHKWSKKLISYYFEDSSIIYPPFYLNGKDIMAALDIERSKVVGDILEEIREASAIGDIKNYDDALNHVRFLKNMYGIE